MLKYIINTKTGIKNIISNYRDNKSKNKIHYNNEIKTDYRDFKDIDLKIIYNNTLFSGPRSAENSILENTISIIKFDII